MKRVILYPYHMRCSGPKEIVNNLRKRGIDAFRVYPDRNYQPRKDDLIIDWGMSTTPKWSYLAELEEEDSGLVMKNYWEVIQNATNKARTFVFLELGHVNIPEFTDDPSQVTEWLEKGHTVVGRQQLNGRGGAGIILMESLDDFQVCPIYTLYKKKKKEFRVHVFDGKVIDFQQKKKKNGVEADSRIRSHNNGWIFARQDVVLPEDMAEQCIKAVAALGLDFGGVDVIWNEAENKSYVLEVNTGPGIEGTTVIKYADAVAALAAN